MIIVRACSLAIVTTLKVKQLFMLLELAYIKIVCVCPLVKDKKELIWVGEISHVLYNCYMNLT